MIGRLRPVARRLAAIVDDIVVNGIDIAVDASNKTQTNL